MKTMKRMVKNLCALSATMIFLGAGQDPVAASEPDNFDAFNRVVVVIDASGSYQGRQANAVAKVDSMLSNMAQRRAKRWERDDEVVIVSLDAIPEVIWRGTAHDLKGAPPAVWQRRFRARSDYSKCTDVAGGFQLAARLLNQTPMPTQKYLFVFSDLINEPPTTSPGRCQPPERPSLPPQNIPWDQLADVSIAVFWMPPEQKFAWSKAMAGLGMGENVALYTASESGEVTLPPPPPAERKVTEAERQENQNRFWAWLQAIGRGTLWIVGSTVLLVIIVTAVRRLRPPRASGPARITGTVPPLTLGQLNQRVRPVGIPPSPRSQSPRDQRGD